MKTKDLIEFKKVLDLKQLEMFEKLEKELKYRIPKKREFELDGIGDSQAFGGTGALNYYVPVCPKCREDIEEDWCYCASCGQSLEGNDENNI